jgi:hypothetical protein
MTVLTYSAVSPGVAPLTYAVVIIVYVWSASSTIKARAICTIVYGKMAEKKELEYLCQKINI